MPRGIDEDCTVLIAAYHAGVFPMAEPDASGRPRRGRAGVRLYTADPRAVVPLAPPGPRWPRSLRSLARRSPLLITADRAFDEVIDRCARAPRPGRWINDWIRSRYKALHARGVAHSVEAWTDDGDGKRTLVGGLYGVHLGAAFFGESMFSDTDAGGEGASKVCFVRLVFHLQRRGFTLLDTQFINPHTALLGAIEIPAAEYEQRLRKALVQTAPWGPWE